jgi:hypothetical protein
MKITVKAKVTDDSKNKLGKIESEFQNYQVYLQSRCTAIVNLYSATKQQAQRALKKIKQPNPKKQYPIINFVPGLPSSANRNWRARTIHPF